MLWGRGYTAARFSGEERTMIFLGIIAMALILWAFAHMSDDINASIEREMRGGEWEEQ